MYVWLQSPQSFPYIGAFRTANYNHQLLSSIMKGTSHTVHVQEIEKIRFLTSKTSNNCMYAILMICKLEAYLRYPDKRLLTLSWLEYGQYFPIVLGRNGNEG